jgi:SAM-dependent methyltransferase
LEKRIADFIKFINHKRKGKSPYAAEFLSGKNKVLDIGCGEGELERQFYRFLGLDISLKNLRKSDILCKGRLIQADATMLPIKDESFEGIMLSNVTDEPVINGWKVKGIYYIGRFSKNRFLYFIFWLLANFGIGARDYRMVIGKTIQ